MDCEVEGGPTGGIEGGIGLAVDLTTEVLSCDFIGNEEPGPPIPGTADE